MTNNYSSSRISYFLVHPTLFLFLPFPLPHHLQLWIQIPPLLHPCLFRLPRLLLLLDHPVVNLEAVQFLVAELVEVLPAQGLNVFLRHVARPRHYDQGNRGHQDHSAQVVRSVLGHAARLHAQKHRVRQGDQGVEGATHYHVVQTLQLLALFESHQVGVLVEQSLDLQEPLLRGMGRGRKHRWLLLLLLRRVRVGVRGWVRRVRVLEKRWLLVRKRWLRRCNLSNSDKAMVNRWLLSLLNLRLYWRQPHLLSLLTPLFPQVLLLLLLLFPLLSLFPAFHPASALLHSHPTLHLLLLWPCLHDRLLRRCGQYYIIWRHVHQSLVSLRIQLGRFRMGWGFGCGRLIAIGRHSGFLLSFLQKEIFYITKSMITNI